MRLRKVQIFCRRLSNKEEQEEETNNEGFFGYW
jgi:hypothetical protein